jgi:hypothetical protein
MTKMPYLLFAGALCAPVMSHAASILGDTYNIDGNLDGSTIGTINDTAAIGGPGYIYSFPDVFLAWFDEDSFDVRVEGATSAFSLTVTLSDLNFKTSGGDLVNITGALWNEADSVYTTYLFDPDNNDTGAPRPTDPSVSSTPTSVTVEFGADWSGQLAGDWPTLRFDVQTERVAAVPEGGATFALLGLGLAGVVAMKRRKG